MKSVMKGMKKMNGMKAALAGLLVAGLVFGGVASAGSKKASAPATHYYFDGGQKRILLLDDTLVAEFGAAKGAVKSAAPKAAVAHSAGAVTIYRVPSAAAVKAAPGANISPVFHEGGTGAGRMMALPGGVLVNCNAAWSRSQVDAWAAGKGLTVIRKLAIGGNWYEIKSETGLAALELANQLAQSGEVVSASPVWWMETSKR